MNASSSRPQSDSAEPLRHDIRLLGRLLGTVIAECEGKRVFDTIETLRRTAVKFRREGNDADGKLLQERVKRLQGSDPNSVARAFSYFLHLSNIAEDRDQNRRQRARALADPAPSRGSLRETVQTLGRHGVGPARIRRLLAEACVMPVLTAHPTEVQRKSTLDEHREIAQALAHRDATLTPEELAEIDATLLGRVATLWQTRMLRYTRLTVADEIENALSYYRSTFLQAIPRLYGDLSRLLNRESAALRRAAPPLEPFLRMGSWIGGDRDGNPNVDAGTLERALLRQATVLFEHYLQEVHALGADLSMTTLLIAADPDLQALADHSGDDSPHRADEPYRRALVGVYARLAATAQVLTGQNLARRSTVAAQAYDGPEAFAADLALVAKSLAAHHGAPIVRLRLAGLQQAVEVFGFHLATVDLRQSSDVHERALAELFTRAGTQYQGQPLDYLALDEDARVALLRAELAQARPLASPWIAYSEDTTRELAVLRAAAAGRARYGKQAVRQTIVSHTETLSDLLEVMVLQKEAGLIAPAGAPIQDDDGLMVVPLFETIPDLQRRGHHGGLARPARDPRTREARAARRAGSHAGLFRQQQGRRLPDLELVAVPGRTRAGGRILRAPRAPAPVPRPRRLGGTRRRLQLRRHPGATAGHGGRPAAPDRAGRSDPEQIQGRRDRPLAPGAAGRGHARIQPGAARRGRQRRRRAHGAPRPGHVLHVRDRATHLSRPGLRNAGLRRVLLRVHAHQRNRRPEHRLASSLAQEGPAHRRPARHSLGLLMGAMPADADRLVRHGLGHRGLSGNRRAGRPPAPRAAGAAARDGARVAGLPHAAVEHGNGAGQVRPGHRRALRPAGAQAGCASASSAPSAPSTAARWPCSLLTQRELLADNPTLQASLRERFAYIDPLNYLQIELIRRHRAAQRDPDAAVDERVQRAIHLTINGIAAGLRNSG